MACVITSFAAIAPPKVLMMDGKPARLFAASGWNVFGGARTVSHVLRINLRPDDGPLPPK